MKHLLFFPFLLLVCSLFAADAAAPAPPASAALSAGAGLAVRGDLLFATGGSASFTPDKALFALSLTDPANPAVIGVCPLPGGFPQALAVSGDIVFVADGVSLHAVNAANPKAMTVVSTLRIAENTENGPVDIAADGTSLVLACGCGGLLVCDVSDPAHMKIVSKIAVPFARSVASDGKGTLVCASDAAGLYVLRAGQVLRRLPFERDSAVKVRIRNSMVYAACGGTMCASFRLNADGTLSALARSVPPSAQYFGTFASDVLPEENGVLVCGGENGILFLDSSLRETGGTGKISGASLGKSMIRRGKILYVSAGGVDSFSRIYAFSGDKQLSRTDLKLEQKDSAK